VRCARSTTRAERGEITAEEALELAVIFGKDGELAAERLG
jgi:hypothetical protein